ncbi:MAG TPA: hypothetical protein VHR66_22885 [Gemmataceae bacterium]|nr:hypothetical protein [Gemmataceae bacterium]
MDILLAEIDVAGKAGKYVLYGLAVAGGFMVGNLLTWAICRLVARMALKSKMPAQLERALRILGGVAVAILVGYLLFRFGSGWGLGGSGTGEGDGKSGTNIEGTHDPKQKAAPKGETKSAEEKATLASGTKVTIHRGATYPKSFQFEGDADAVDLATAKQKLRQRQDSSAGQLKFVDLLFYRNSMAEIHPSIEEFETFAHALGLRTSRQPVEKNLPE